MDKEIIKNTVRKAFDDVDSTEFLRKKLDLQIIYLRNDFENFKRLNPGKNYNDWIIKASEINTRTNSNSEILAMGIYLLAL